jgi:hypothetical protein
MNTAAEYLAVPLLFTVEPFQDRDGIWRFRTAYPELAGCQTTAEFLTHAMDRLELLRVDLTLALLSRGEQPPRPREPIVEHIPLLTRQLAQHDSSVKGPF